MARVVSTATGAPKRGTGGEEVVPGESSTVSRSFPRKFLDLTACSVVGLVTIVAVFGYTHTHTHTHAYTQGCSNRFLTHGAT